MEHVYLVFDAIGFRMACKNELDATLKVNSIARDEWGFDTNTPPDYLGTLCRYGWNDVAWWIKTIIY